MFKTLLVTTAIVSLVCSMGCRENTGDPIAVTPPSDETPLTKDDSVKANAYLIRDAADAYAAANNGYYPNYVDHELPDGRTLIDFLPDGVYLRNPYTGESDSPSHSYAYWPGEVSYSSFTGQTTRGYFIQGIGEEAGEAIVTLQLDPRNP